MTEEQKLTACLYCQHRLRIGSGTLWYENFCRAAELEKVFDPIRGAYEQPLDRYHYCRDINKNGKCEYYKQIKD